MTDAFYEPLEGGRFRSTNWTVGPWDPGLQHGSPPAALLGRVLERLAPRPGVRIARFAMDFLGPIPVEELTIDAEVLRPGSRIELVTATARSKARPILRASAWRIAAEAGRSPIVAEPGQVPKLPPAQPQIFFPGIARFPYGEALEWRFVDGGFERLGPATVWARPRIPLLPGEDTSALGRLLLMVDSANGISAELPIAEWTFVPVELTVVVERYPRGEWTGMSARTTVGADGIGHTTARLFDEEGFLGHSVQTLYVAPSAAAAKAKAKQS
jgi:hypothetical protein